MKENLYVKTVLTVIAAALMYLCVLQSRDPVVYAQQQNSIPVMIGTNNAKVVPVVVVSAKPDGVGWEFKIK